MSLPVKSCFTQDFSQLILNNLQMPPKFKFFDRHIFDLPSQSRALFAPHRVFKIQGFVCKHFLPSPSPTSPVFLCFLTPQKCLLCRLKLYLSILYSITRSIFDQIIARFLFLFLLQLLIFRTYLVKLTVHLVK